MVIVRSVRNTSFLLIVVFLGFVGLLILVYSNQKPGNSSTNIWKTFYMNNEDELNTLRRTAVLNLYERLKQSEFKVYSQNMEDGVNFELIKIFDLNRTRSYVEMGTQSGKECNSR